MNTNDFIIEVKTNWYNTNNKYSRKIIEYACNNSEEHKEFYQYIKDLTPINIYDEFSQEIDENKIEITAKTKINKVIINNPNELIKYLLKYTEYQWLNEK